MMGSLLKMSRRGRWQRRFFMLPQGQPALYYAKARHQLTDAAGLLASMAWLPGGAQCLGSTMCRCLQVPLIS